MTDESTLVDIAEDVGVSKTCITAIKERLVELEERPCIPKWFARWFNAISIISFVGLVSFFSVSYYRLGQVEKTCVENGRKFDRIVYAISVELSQRQVNQPDISSVPLTPSTHSQEPTRLFFSDKPDNSGAKQIYTRLMATVNSFTKL